MHSDYAKNFLVLLKMLLLKGNVQCIGHWQKKKKKIFVIRVVLEMLCSTGDATERSVEALEILFRVYTSLKRQLRAPFLFESAA